MWTTLPALLEATPHSECRQHLSSSSTAGSLSDDVVVVAVSDPPPILGPDVLAGAPWLSSRSAGAVPVQHRRQLVLVHTCIPSDAVVQISACARAGEEFGDAVGGVGEPLGEAGEEGSEEAAGEAGLIGTGRDVVVARSSSLRLSSWIAFTIGGMRPVYWIPRAPSGASVLVAPRVTISGNTFATSWAMRPICAAVEEFASRQLNVTGSRRRHRARGGTTRRRVAMRQWDGARRVRERVGAMSWNASAPPPTTARTVSVAKNAVLAARARCARRMWPWNLSLSSWCGGIHQVKSALSADGCPAWRCSSRRMRASSVRQISF